MNPKFKFFIKVFFFITIFVLINLFTKKTQALNLRSPRYKIQFSNIEFKTQPKTYAKYNISINLGQKTTLKFNTNGYAIKTEKGNYFSFTISNTILNFDTPIPNNPKVVSTTLKIEGKGISGYKVTVVELGPLTILNKAYYIPDTNCDGQANTCTESLAAIWKNTTTYGFGYNIAGQDIPSDFINSNYYRPFPNKLKKEKPVIIMSSANVKKTRKATLTLKVNIPPIQPTGNYQTILHLIATPSY